MGLAWNLMGQTTVPDKENSDKAEKAIPEKAIHAPSPVW
jgi:hypothetical protein